MRGRYIKRAQIYANGLSGFANTLERGFCDSVSRQAARTSAGDIKVRAFDDTPAAHRFVFNNTSGLNSTIQGSGSTVPVDAAAR